MGILDLGGGSTQITFLPKSKVNETFNAINRCLESVLDENPQLNICCFSHRKRFSPLPLLTSPDSTSSTIHISFTHTGKQTKMLQPLQTFQSNLHISPITHHDCVSTSHSYLGNGLYAARLATLGALGADGKSSKAFYHLTLCSVPFFHCGINGQLLLFFSQV